jgi:hypothetical protein
MKTRVECFPSHAFNIAIAVSVVETYHGVSSTYLQEYLHKFCYRFNRRAWQPELPLRLLNACLTHAQVKLRII